MEDPGLYARHGAKVFETAGAFLDELWPRLTWPDPPLPALDVGCGTGEVSRQVIAARLPSGVRLIATDVSPAMLKHADKHNALPGVIQYDVYDAASRHLEQTRAWEHAPYGKIFTVYSMHWIPDNRRAILNMYKLLASGGEAVFVMMATSPFLAHDIVGKDPRWSKYMQDVELFLSPYHYSKDPTADFLQLLLDAGFEVVYRISEPRSIDYDTKEDCKGILTSVNPFLNRIPAHEKEDFMNAVWEANLKQKSITIRRDEDTGKTKFSYNFPCILCVARKP
ncbi:juvenile hormone acid O-methyltransferase-like [Schistocerca americana]|uniref:juvenile hormone acid O-methyltransferase-like n=1 Tax=Schistocerca americana TaxID=7009 RepID=UPI001F4FB0B0|nr:juvenile hormone acid O-methyltransferase-like [Schistocerca americana]